jgi:hypothetical protein
MGVSTCAGAIGICDMDAGQDKLGEQSGFKLVLQHN